jgi:predicted permease
VQAVTVPLLFAACICALVFGIELEQGVGYTTLGWWAIAAAACALMGAVLSLASRRSD